MMNEVPTPIRFNAFKHHRNYMLKVLADSSPADFIKLLDLLCHNYIDIYIGEFTALQIAESVIEILTSENLISFDSFKIWPDKNGGHRSVTIADQSEWILRLSEEHDRFIHIHPARTGKQVVRFKGSTLKIIFQLKSNGIQSVKQITLGKLNEVRIEVGLSPIKKIEKNKGVLKGFEGFF